MPDGLPTQSRTGAHKQLQMPPWWTLLGCFLVIIAGVDSFRIRPPPAGAAEAMRPSRYVRLRLEPPAKRNNPLTSGALWFDQKLDHFNPTDKTTFKQRYFNNPESKVDGGPVFIWISGEAASSGSWTDDGNMYDMGKTFGANIFEIEHRYYGKSHPTNDTEAKNLRWLTSDQALADLAYFIQSLKKSGEIESNAKVIVFGGSYSGCLAAWARIKYPHLIYAAVSSSGPILAEADFTGFYETIGNDVERFVGDWCVDNIRKGFQRTHELMETEDGRSAVQNVYRPCSDFNYTNADDLQNFYAYIAFPWSTMAQGYRANDKHQPFPRYCSYFSGKNLTDDEAMAGLAAVILDVYAIPSSGCMDYGYQSSIVDEKSTSWSAGFVDSRMWYFQTCVQFGFYQTDDSGGQPFGTGLFDLNGYVVECRDLFGEMFDVDLLARGVKNTNRQYGGKNPDVTRVVFVNGDVDPWHTLGRTENLNSESPAILISGASHGNDAYSYQPTDTQEIIAARERIRDILSGFIYDG